MEATLAPTPTRTSKCHDSLTRFFARVKNLFTHIIPDYLDAHIVGIIAFVQGLKAFIENPEVQGVVDGLLPKIGPVMFKAIQDNVDKVLELLEIELECKGVTNFEDKMKCIAQQLATKNPALQAMLLHGVAVYLTRLTSGDEQVTETELKALVAFAENEFAHANNAPAVTPA